ncbi:MULTISPECIES: MFS transporter [unclassified Paenibacillus]|uniref:MFS transporter n=1 Tax=unclassified Paenibacillus TaxID=185978 RepID=UPI001AE92692|nr:MULTISPECIES: MFS transporter [unclassified Paenibacillus]MBP1155424.1 MFS family permease [Paenibacillus sp. PvP091]MBP1169191.1 MFS family permease [Paenibacillus sp. PvR098]MBP2440219.1 MFS family permease [Paenibacillus sp. PvP052]
MDLSPLFHVMRCKPFYIAGISAFTAAVPFVLIYSFYPVFFKELGFSEATIGGITALLSVGYIIIGFTYGKLESLLGRKFLLCMGMAGTGIWIILSPFISNMWIFMILIMGLGVTGGYSNVLYQLLTTQYSNKEQRNVSLAFVGLFWSIAQLTVPLGFGWVAEREKGDNVIQLQAFYGKIV